MHAEAVGFSPSEPIIKDGGGNYTARMRVHIRTAFVHRPLATSLLFVSVVGCRDATGTNNDEPSEAGASRDAAIASGIDDGGPSVDAASRPDARAPSAHEAGVGALDASTTHEDAALTNDASRSETSTSDGAVAAWPEAGPMFPTDGGAACDVDACNFANACVRRGWWTECSCDPAPLPACEFPRFRAIGASRTDGERTLYLLSGDGRVVAGTHTFERDAAPIGATWTLAAGLQPLPQDPAGPTIPTAINADGAVIFGRVELRDGGTLSVAWYDGALEHVSPDAGPPFDPDPSASIPPDGTPLTRYFEIFDATPDGAVVVGKTRRSYDSPRMEAAFWTEEAGVQLLAEYLESRGTELNGWDLWHVNAVSDDGKTMMGLGIGPDVGYRWYAQLEAPTR